MNCVYENDLYIYNIELMEENTLLIKKITFKHIFCFTYSIFFINSTKHVFFLEQKPFSRIQFPNTIFFSFFWRHKKLFLKIVFKNCFS